MYTYIHKQWQQYVLDMDRHTSSCPDENIQSFRLFLMLKTKYFIHTYYLALSCTGLSGCLPSSCCGQLKDSSSSPKGRWLSASVECMGMTDGVPQDPVPMWKVMLTLNWGLAVRGLMIWGLVGWEKDSEGIVGWGVTGSVLESKVMGSDTAGYELFKANVDCKGLMESWLQPPSVLVKVSVELLGWL